VQKYLRASKDKDATTVRVHVRALVSILENFRFSLDDSLQHQPESAEDVEAEEDLAEHEPRWPNPREHECDVKKVSGAASIRLLPGLLDYLSNRDETEDSLRIPISYHCNAPASRPERKAERSTSEGAAHKIQETWCARRCAELSLCWVPRIFHMLCVGHNSTSLPM